MLTRTLLFRLVLGAIALAGATAGLRAGETKEKAFECWDNKCTTGMQTCPTEEKYTCRMAPWGCEGWVACQ
jgi:hypothetical protein